MGNQDWYFRLELDNYFRKLPKIKIKGKGGYSEIIFSINSNSALMSVYHKLTDHICILHTHIIIYLLSILKPNKSIPQKTMQHSVCTTYT